ncbi:hypothetical protein [Pseudomonas retamae]|uniref:Uncharacterized protein n=1 Tax=Pseudomonas retamae TaxID=702110 RepID=A0ABW7DFJ9_9PSED
MLKPPKPGAGTVPSDITPSSLRPQAGAPDGNAAYADLHFGLADQYKAHLHSTGKPGAPDLPAAIDAQPQPLQTFENPHGLAHNTPVELRYADAQRIVAETPVYLAAQDAARLTPASATEDGVRYDKHRKTYVDTARGTVMVRKNSAGQYQQVFAATRDVPTVLFERIAGTRLWRHKPPGNQPADEATDASQTLGESLLSAHPGPLNLRFGLWRDWARSVRPALGQHIEIDGHFYPIVRQDVNAHSLLVYLENPLFSPALYDAFEYMLRDHPSLQPRYALMNNNQWTVLDSVVPFEMPITQYIARTFKSLADRSVSALARAMFNQASRSEIITGTGLALLNRVLHYWTHRQLHKAPQGQLADPLLMLRRPRAITGSRPLPSTPDYGLSRLDFDPARFAQHWNRFASQPSTARLQQLFSEVLADEGYVIEHAAPEDTRGDVRFHRDGIDQVFALRVYPVNAFDDAGPVPTEGERMRTRDGVSDTVWLRGGVQVDALGQTTLFVVRES